MQPRNYFGGIIFKESSQKCHLCDFGKKKGQHKATTTQKYTTCKTERLFTQLTKRQSGLSLHLCQHAARLRALVLRALTLCPLRLVFFLKFFSHWVQDRRTPDWHDRLKRKWSTQFYSDHIIPSRDAIKDSSDPARLCRH